MRIRVGFMLGRRRGKKERALEGQCHCHRELGHTGVRDHSETLRHQNRRNSTACRENAICQK